MTPSVPFAERWFIKMSNLFVLKEQLQVGEVSNMYDILERMREAAKTITL